MSDEEAKQAALGLREWARKRWGVETERQYRCPNYGEDYYYDDYEGYCPHDGRKLREVVVESDSQTWQHNLDMFIALPDYLEPPKGEED